VVDPLSVIHALETQPAPPSPENFCWSVAQCHDEIVNRFERKGTNFLGAIKVLRRIHDNFDPIRLHNDSKDMMIMREEEEDDNPDDDDDAPDDDGDDQHGGGRSKAPWLYPCRGDSTNCGSYVVLRRRAKAEFAYCSVCLTNSHRAQRNKTKRQQRSLSSNRQSPVNSLDKTQLQVALSAKTKALKIKTQANERLKKHLEARSPSITLKTVPEACDVLKKGFTCISSNRKDAVQLILNAIIDFEVGDGLMEDLQEDHRQRYAEFIVSDIRNACKKFVGATNEIRFHPIMANLATNLYIGMKFEDFADIAPFVFPTVRSVQRNRSKVACKEGSDPKVYAREAKVWEV
jgi:hypothetical protein